MVPYGLRASLLSLYVAFNKYNSDKKYSECEIFVLRVIKNAVTPRNALLLTNRCSISKVSYGIQ